MKHASIFLTAAFACLPLLAQAGAFMVPFKAAPKVTLHLAQETRPAPPLGAPQAPEGALPEEAPEGLIEQGAKLLLRGIFEQIRPQMETHEFSGNLALLSQLSQLITEIDQFHAPEVLPNGDVLIRRKAAGESAPRKAPRPPQAAPVPPSDEIETGPNGEVDL